MIKYWRDTHWRTSINGDPHLVSGAGLTENVGIDTVFPRIGNILYKKKL